MSQSLPPPAASSAASSSSALPARPKKKNKNRKQGNPAQSKAIDYAANQFIAQAQCPEVFPSPVPPPGFISKFAEFHCAPTFDVKFAADYSSMFIMHPNLERTLLFTRGSEFSSTLGTSGSSAALAGRCFVPTSMEWTDMFPLRPLVNNNVINLFPVAKFLNQGQRYVYPFKPTNNVPATNLNVKFTVEGAVPKSLEVQFDVYTSAGTLLTSTTGTTDSNNTITLTTNAGLTGGDQYYIQLYAKNTRMEFIDVAFEIYGTSTINWTLENVKENLVNYGIKPVQGSSKYLITGMQFVCTNTSSNLNNGGNGVVALTQPGLLNWNVEQPSLYTALSMQPRDAYKGAVRDGFSGFYRYDDLTNMDVRPYGDPRLMNPSLFCVINGQAESAMQLYAYINVIHTGESSTVKWKTLPFSDNFAECRFLYSNMVVASGNGIHLDAIRRKARSLIGFLKNHKDTLSKVGKAVGAGAATLATMI